MHWLVMIVLGTTVVSFATVASAAERGCRRIEGGRVIYSNRCDREVRQPVPSVLETKRRIVVLSEQARRGQVPDLPLALIISEAAGRHGISSELIKSVIIVESGGNPRAVGRSGERGLMQLLPSTANTLGVRDSFDPWQNIQGGTRFLRDLLDRFDGNVALALAGYNAGPGAVERSRGIPANGVTPGYVRKVLSLYRGGREPISWEVNMPQSAPVKPPRPANATSTRLGYRWVTADGVVVYANLPREELEKRID